MAERRWRGLASDIDLWKTIAEIGKILVVFVITYAWDVWAMWWGWSPPWRAVVALGVFIGLLHLVNLVASVRRSYFGDPAGLPLDDSQMVVDRRADATMPRAAPPLARVEQVQPPPNGQRHLGSDVVTVSWHAVPERLRFLYRNNTVAPLEGCSLTVLDLMRRSQSEKEFMLVGEYHREGAFVPLDLGAAQTVFGETATSIPFLAWSSGLGLFRVDEGLRQGAPAKLKLSTAGVWRVELLVRTRDAERREFHYFEWTGRQNLRPLSPEEAGA